MLNTSTYLHILDGRIRVKIASVKGSPQQAAAVKELLQGLPGITQITANPLTGNVLILFDPRTLGQEQILGLLKRHGYLSKGLNSSQRSNISVGIENSLAQYLAQSAIEIGFKLLVSALI